MKEIVKTLIKGRPVIDEQDNVLYLKGFVLGLEHQSITESEEYDLKEVENLEIYISKEMQEIEKLNRIIKQQQELIEKLSTPQGKRKGYKHLTKEEISEIEEIFMSEKSIDLEDIAKVYDSSLQTIKRIEKGNHTKTSSKYKTYLMK